MAACGATDAIELSASTSCAREGAAARLIARLAAAIDGRKREVSNTHVRGGLPRPKLEQKRIIGPMECSLWGGCGARPVASCYFAGLHNCPFVERHVRVWFCRCKSAPRKS